MSPAASAKLFALVRQEEVMGGDDRENRDFAFVSLVSNTGKHCVQGDGAVMILFGAEPF